MGVSSAGGGGGIDARDDFLGTFTGGGEDGMAGEGAAGADSVRMLEKDIGSVVRVGFCCRLSVEFRSSLVLFGIVASQLPLGEGKHTLGEAIVGSAGKTAATPLFCLATGVSIAAVTLGDWAVDPNRLGGCECDVPGDWGPGKVAFTGDVKAPFR